MYDVVVRRALRWEGFVAHVQQKKPLLTRIHVHAWVRFARMYAKWTIHDWKHVIFSDETKINMLNSGGRSWCWITDRACTTATCPTKSKTSWWTDHDLGLYDNFWTWSLA